MGHKASASLDVTEDQLIHHLLAHHSIFMRHINTLYYLTDANEGFWRAQDTSKLNAKGHFVDCSAIVPTITEFINLPWLEGRSLANVCNDCTFYESIPQD